MTRCQSLGVSLHPGELRTLDRAVAEELREIGLVESEEIGQRCRAIFFARRERGVRFSWMRVPGADFLADVASEDISREIDVGKCATVLDRRVADAMFRCDRAIRQDRVRRTRVDTPRARAAAIGDRRAA